MAENTGSGSAEFKKGMTEREKLLTADEGETKHVMKDPIKEKLQDIINNKQLSIELKTELIKDMIMANQKQKDLQKQREHLPAANKVFLSGAGETVSKHTNIKNETSSNTEKIQMSRRDNRLLPPKQRPRQGKTGRRCEEGLRNEGKEEEEEDQEESETESNSGKERKIAWNGSSKRNGTNEGLEEDEEDVEEEEEEEEEAGDDGEEEEEGDELRNESTENESNDEELDDDEDQDSNDEEGPHVHFLALTNKIEQTCKRHKIPVPTKRLKNIIEILTKYLPISVQNGFRSDDNKFALSIKGQKLMYKEAGRSTVSFPLIKLLATLTLSTESLFKFLKAYNRKVVSYTSNEKLFIRKLVRLSDIFIKNIPCKRIRDLCT